MKTYMIAAAVLVAVIGVALYIRYKKYKTWNKFLDDAFEQLTFDFLPGPVRILLVMVLVVWGGSSLVSYFTKDLKFKEPGAQPAAAPLNQLANASQLPAMPPPPVAGAAEQEGGGGGNPPPASQLTPEQTAALMDQLKQIAVPEQPAGAPSAEQQADSKKDEGTKVEDLLAKLPGMPKPEAENKKDENAEKEKAAAAVAKKLATRVLPSQTSTAALQPNMLVLQAASPIASSAAAPAFSTAAQLAANIAASKGAAQEAQVAAVKAEQYEAFIKEYDLVVKSKSGTCFDGRLIHDSGSHKAFVRPCGDIISIPATRVAKVIKGPRKYPLELDSE